MDWQELIKENDYYVIINKYKRESFVPIQNNFHKIYTSVIYNDYLKRDFFLGIGLFAFKIIQSKN